MSLMMYPGMNQSFQPVRPAQSFNNTLNTFNTTVQHSPVPSFDSYGFNSPIGGGNVAQSQQVPHLNANPFWTPPTNHSPSSNTWPVAAMAAAAGGMAANPLAQLTQSNFGTPASSFKPELPLPSSSAISSRPAASRKTSIPPVVEASPAEQTGKKVGELVTTLLEENPGLQEKLDNIDFNKLKSNLGPSLEKYRVSLNQALKRVPRKVDQFIIRQFPDPQMKEYATQLSTWLRQPPDPKVLAALQREKRVAAAEQALKAELEPSIEEKPKPGLLRRLTSKLWPFGRDKTQASASSFNDADLEALLGEVSRPKRRTRPAIDAY